MRHLIDPMDLSVEEVDHLLVLAQDIIDNKRNTAKSVRAKSLQLCSLNQAHAQDLASRLP